MQKNSNSNLKKRVIDEMTVDYSNSLEKNFNLAKQYVRITKDGKVDVLLKDRFNGKEKILLYLIGKLYAKEAELSDDEWVGNDELLEELSIPIGSLLPRLKDLRDNRTIKPTKRGKYTYHRIYINLIERTLKQLDNKIRSMGKNIGE